MSSLSIRDSAAASIEVECRVKAARDTVVHARRCQRLARILEGTDDIKVKFLTRTGDLILFLYTLATAIAPGI